MNTSKKVSVGRKEMEPFFKGLKIAAEVVGSTLGPKGRNVFLEEPMTGRITNDGVSIASRIMFKNPEEDAGAWVVRNVTAATNDTAGDGTTTTAVLLESLVEECLKRPESPMEVERSLREAAEKVEKQITKRSVKIAKEDIERVALISAEDPELAKLIAQIIHKLGEGAVINVEDSKTYETHYELVEGFEVPFGYMAPYQPLGKLTYQEVPVLCVLDRIANPYGIDTLFGKLGAEGQRQCVIVCNEIENETLGVLGISKAKGLFDSVVIRATPEAIKDIAGATGAAVVGAETGITFQNLESDHLGKARKVVVDQNKTLVLGDSVASALYAKRLEALAENEENIYLSKGVMDRVSKLKGSIAVLRVAAPTDAARGYKRDKAEDAVKSSLAALESGVVEGGGMTLWRISQELKPKTIGEEIIKRALTAPLRKIIENAGKDYAEVVLGLPEGMGYNAKDDSYVNMTEAGILDAAKVALWSLKNSVDAASKLITTGAIVTQHEESN